MSKGSKGSKASKKSGSKKGGFYPLDDTNPYLYFGTGSFDLPNGDKYEGEYCAHKYGIVWREGHGSYITKEGQIYECDWSKDKIVEGTGVTITFPSGEIYQGVTLKDQYSGPGTYYFEHTMPISCLFQNNHPVGNVVLVDLNGRLWEGEVLPKEEGALLLPENSLYTQLDEEDGKGKEKRSGKHKIQSQVHFSSHDHSVEKEGEGSLTFRELEKMIFTRKEKIDSYVDLTNSEWCQKFMRFKTMKATVMEKLEHDEDLNCVEQEWYDKYSKFKYRIRKTSQYALNTTLSQMPDGGDAEKMNIPVPTIYVSKKEEEQPTELQETVKSINDIQEIQEQNA